MPHKTPATQGKIRLAILFTLTLAANYNKCRHYEHLATEYQIFTCISITKKSKRCTESDENVGFQFSKKRTKPNRPQILKTEKSV